MPWADINLQHCLQDTPMHRRQFTAVENAVSSLEAHIKDFAKSARSSLQAGKQYAEESVEMARNLERFAKGGFGHDASDEFIVKAFSKFAKALSEVHRSSDILSSEALLEPMESFVTGYIHPSRDLRRQFDTLAANADAHLEKYMSKRASDPTLVDAAQDVQLARHALHSCNLDYAETLNDMRRKKKYSVVEGVVAWLYTYYAWLRQAWETMRELEPVMRALSQDMADAREQAQLGRRRMEEMKEKLLLKGKAWYNPLSRGMFLLGHLEDAREKPETNGGKGDRERQPKLTGCMESGTEVAGGPDHQVDPEYLSCYLHDNMPEGRLFKVGYLYMYEQSWKSRWTRRFFVLQGSLLHYSHRDRQDEPTVACDLRFSTVRVPEALGQDRKCAFEVVGAQRTYQLQAENDAEMKSWVDAVQRAIARALEAGNPNGGTAAAAAAQTMNDEPLSSYLSQKAAPQGEPSGPQKVAAIETSAYPAPAGARKRVLDADEEAKERAKLVRALKSVTGNLVCADCRSPDPEWVSVNLGVLLCIECSGIHRSLGVHVSKVRSIILDKLEPEVVELLIQLGNEKVNALLCSDGQAAEPGDVRSVKETFIKHKYVDRLYLRTVPALWTAAESRDEAFWTAMQQQRFLDGFLLLLHGADINFAHPRHCKMTPLHQAIANGHALVVQFLLSWNAHVDAVDVKGKTPLHFAAEGDWARLTIILLGRGADVTIKDEDGNAAVDVAVRKSHVNIITIFRLHSFNEDEASKSFRFPPVEGYKETLESFKADKEIERRHASASTISSPPAAAARSPSSVLVAAEREVLRVSSPDVTGVAGARDEKELHAKVESSEQKHEDPSPDSATGS